jgi:hypothetical protein
MTRTSERRCRQRAQRRGHALGPQVAHVHAHLARRAHQVSAGGGRSTVFTTSWSASGVLTTAASGLAWGSLPGGRGSFELAASGSDPSMTVPPKIVVSPASGAGGGPLTGGGSMTTTSGSPDLSRRCELQLTSAPTRTPATIATHKRFKMFCFMGQIQLKSIHATHTEPADTRSKNVFIRPNSESVRTKTVALAAQTRRCHPSHRVRCA